MRSVTDERSESDERSKTDERPETDERSESDERSVTDVMSEMDEKRGKRVARTEIQKEIHRKRLAKTTFGRNSYTLG